MSSAATVEKETSGLNLSDVGKKSEMETLGWSINQAEDKTWSAHEKAGDLRSLGPAKSISALHPLVMIAAGKGENGKVKKVGSSKLADGEFKENSQPILTGTEDAVFEDMTNLGKAYRATTDQILTLQAEQSDQKKALEPMMKKFRDQLVADPDGEINGKGFIVILDGRRVFIGLNKEETEKVKTHFLKD